MFWIRVGKWDEMDQCVRLSFSCRSLDLVCEERWLWGHPQDWSLPFSTLCWPTRTLSSSQKKKKWIPIKGSKIKGSIKFSSKTSPALNQDRPRDISSPGHLRPWSSRQVRPWGVKTSPALRQFKTSPALRQVRPWDMSSPETFLAEKKIGLS